MPTSRQPTSPPAPGAIERLYVYWVVSTALLLLAVISLALLSRAASRQQAAQIDDLSRQMVELHADVKELQTPVTTPPAAQPSSDDSNDTASPRNTAGGARDRRAEERAAAPAPARSQPRAAPKPIFPPEAEITTRLDSLLPARPTSPLDVRNRTAAAALLDVAIEHVARADWGGATWARLAVLARLMGRDTGADSFARRAGDEQSLATLMEVSIRSLLAHGDTQEAETTARRLLTLTPDAPTARVLLAAALLANHQPAVADETLSELAMDGVSSAALNVYDRLLLARVLLALEDRRQLAEVVDNLGQVPDELRAERDFLSAVVMARGAEAVRALAILDGLAADARDTPRRNDLAWQPPHPTRYQIEVWRGVTLVHAQQLDAAREALRDAVGLDPVRGDAQYYLGLLEARAGRGAAALNHLRNAVACAPRMAAAWEALATLDIDADRVDAALESLETALAINNRRASAHFLAAIANAKATRRAPAAAALRTAFALDERFVEEARRMAVLTHLFSADELSEMAAAP